MSYLGFSYLIDINGNIYKIPCNILHSYKHIIICNGQFNKPVDCLKNIILKHNIKLIYFFKKQWMYIC